MVVVSDRQNNLYMRYARIMVEDPVSMEKEWPRSGIGRSSFLLFGGNKKQLSRNTLNRLEKFIVRREKELGL